MFGRKVAIQSSLGNANLLEEVTKRTEETLTIPIPQLVVTEDKNLDEYEKLAKELNFYPAKLLEEKLLHFFANQEIKIFAYNQVFSYLKQKAEKEDKSWIWRPLRERDKPNGWMFGDANFYNFTDKNGKKRREKLFNHGCYRPEWDYRPYDKPVPMRILQEVKKIEREFSEKLLFFVSDYATARPDPFIMVTALDINRFIFDVWDEPDYFD